jgi:cytochrome P450
MNAGLLAYTPNWLKPIVGPVITLPNRYRKWQVKRSIQSMYEERVKHLRDPSLSPDYEEPHDSLQMMLRYAMDNYPSDLTLEHISARLCLANLASFHQTAVAISNVLLNVAASDSEFNIVATLQEEIASVLDSQPGNWTKNGVAKMLRTDSVLRESMRLNAFGNRAMIRKVIDPKGLITEDGHLLPNGSTLSILSHPIHNDDEVFGNAGKFDPFRFSRIREAANQGPGMEGSKGDPSNLSFVATGPTYLPFGHGKHACPGRNLVDFELKMILGEIVMKYDIELAPEYNGMRPEGVWITEAVMPPFGAKIRVRRKKNASS